MAFSVFDLPWEDVLFSKIFPLLDMKDLFNLGFVCNKGRDCTTQYFSTLKKIELDNNFSAVAFERLTRNCDGLKTLKLKDCSWANDNVLAQVFVMNKGLENVDLSGCNNLHENCLLPLAVNCKGVKVLGLGGCNWISCSTMQTLMTLNFNELEEIDFSSCNSISNQDLGEFLTYFKELKRISLAYCQSVTDATLFSISHHCKSLIHLDVDACTGITDHGIRSVGEYCSCLRSLQVRNCHRVTEFSIRVLRHKVFLEIDFTPIPDAHYYAIEIPIRMQV